MIVAGCHTFSMVIVVSGWLFTLFANLTNYGDEKEKEKLINKKNINSSYGSYESNNNINV